MTTAEVANELVSLCREGRHMEVIQNYYADDIVSREMPGTPNELTTGIKAVFAKGEAFFDSLAELHSGSVSDPVVAGNHFAIKMSMDASFKDGSRVDMDEIAVYEVKDGKIVNEQFFYTM